jgi:EAL domain-containing protein (putative c-di-GMP-specific phosphodiesterase class I)
VGAEALIRWQHPVKGFISPAKFIPIAERCGLIVPIGEWVLNEACRFAKTWEEKHHLPRMVIAVNLSAQQLKRNNIVEVVINALKQSGLSASQLELELTESVLMHDMNIVKLTLQSLKDIGVKFSIDDFGTGYSSLSYLKQLAVDKLKIDQSFVRDMVSNQEDADIVKAIVDLGNALHLITIAEGVETSEQLAILREYGCDVIQGYYFSRPLPMDAFITFCQAKLPN